MAPSPRRVRGDALVHLRRARDRLDRYLAGDLALDDVAQLACMSRFHLLGSFATTYGEEQRGGAATWRGAMITHIPLVSVPVRDIDDALAFCTDVLGFERGEDLPST